jgi:mono/diheme cytochrome c family protein
MNRLLPLAAVLLASAAVAGGPPSPPATASGASLYRQLCVSCHGPGAHGDGPVAPALRTPVPDLTRISARHGGEFPADGVREMIDGRAALPAHGSREMPVWGYELEAGAPANAPGRASAQAMTDRLVEYLRSIQQP